MSMVIRKFVAAAGAAMLLGATSSSASAERPDVHSDTGARVSSLAPMSASSQTFQLIGIVNGQHLTFHLDRRVDASRVKHATVELQIAGTRVAARPYVGGEYEADLIRPVEQAVTPVIVDVAVGDQSERLVGRIESVEAATHWQDVLGWILVGVATLLFTLSLVLDVLRRQRSPARGDA